MRLEFTGQIPLQNLSKLKKLLQLITMRRETVFSLPVNFVSEINSSTVYLLAKSHLRPDVPKVEEESQWIPLEDLKSQHKDMCDGSVFLHVSVNHKIYYRKSAAGVGPSKGQPAFVCLRASVNGLPLKGRVMRSQYYSCSAQARHTKEDHIA